MQHAYLISAVWGISAYFFASSMRVFFPFIGLWFQAIFLLLIIAQFYYIPIRKSYEWVIPLVVCCFQALFVLYGVLGNENDLGTAFIRSKYLMIFLLLPTFKEIVEANLLNKLLSLLSFTVLVKAVLIITIGMDCYFGNGWISDMLRQHTSLYFGPIMVLDVPMYRVFDPFVIFYPIALYQAERASLPVRVLVHILIAGYVFFSMALGLWVIYCVVLCCVVSTITLKRILVLWSLIALTALPYWHEVEMLVREIWRHKALSAGVKWQQLVWISEELSLFGKGVGAHFLINGRADTMLEVLPVYWLATYGIIGSLFFGGGILGFPLMKFSMVKRSFQIRFCYMMFYSALGASLTNPYAICGLVFMFLCFIYAAFLSSHIGSLDGGGAPLVASRSS